jgi:hypothetical protein
MKQYSTLELHSQYCLCPSSRHPPWAQSRGMYNKGSVPFPSQEYFSICTRAGGRGNKGCLNRLIMEIFSILTRLWRWFAFQVKGNVTRPSFRAEQTGYHPRKYIQWVLLHNSLRGNLDRSPARTWQWSSFPNSLRAFLYSFPCLLTPFSPPCSPSSFSKSKPQQFRVCFCKNKSSWPFLLY